MNTEQTVSGEHFAKVGMLSPMNIEFAIKKQYYGDMNDLAWHNYVSSDVWETGH